MDNIQYKIKKYSVKSKSNPHNNTYISKLIKYRYIEYVVKQNGDKNINTLVEEANRLIKEKDNRTESKGTNVDCDKIIEGIKKLKEVKSKDIKQLQIINETNEKKSTENFPVSHTYTIKYNSNYDNIIINKIETILNNLSIYVESGYMKCYPDNPYFMYNNQKYNLDNLNEKLKDYKIINLIPTPTNNTDCESNGTDCCYDWSFYIIYKNYYIFEVKYKARNKVIF
jgi:hypothetical protein